MKNKIIYFFSFLTLCFINNGCVEEFKPGTLTFEDAIVIEATITNEYKYQKILLSRTFKFEEELKSESGAIVKITSSSNQTYNFQETKAGVYVSNVQFSATNNTDYQLFITTNNGKEYESETIQLVENNALIDNLYAIKGLSTDGTEGIGIYLDGSNATNNSNYYGYEYEETYKYIAPYWRRKDLVLESENPIRFSLVDRVEEERVCYITKNSKGRLLTDTNLQSENKVENFLINFIPLKDFRLNSRYSISVKQYIQSQKSYNYIKTLNKFSDVESLLSQTQTGFFAGNIFSVQNKDEMVIGIFEVSSISEKRIFFDRFDFIKTTYPINCTISSPEHRKLAVLVKNNSVKFLDNPDGVGIVYEVVNRACGDCRVYGTNVRPTFWID